MRFYDIQNNQGSWKGLSAEAEELRQATLTETSIILDIT